MRRDGIWGDNVEIQCLSEIYDRPVEVYAYRAGNLRLAKCFCGCFRGAEFWFLCCTIANSTDNWSCPLRAAPAQSLVQISTPRKLVCCAAHARDRCFLPSLPSATTNDLAFPWSSKHGCKLFVQHVGSDEWLVCWRKKFRPVLKTAYCARKERFVSKKGRVSI